jgi:competence protein ComEC
LDQPPTDANNDSLVVRLDYGEFHVLFTGDVEANVLENLHDPEKLHAEIVKVPHHGSKYSWSEAFYRSVNPNAAVISVGPNNYGHPSGQVLRGLSQMGVACYRTDRTGAVIISSDGDDYQVRTGKSLSNALY